MVLLRRAPVTAAGPVQTQIRPFVRRRGPDPIANRVAIRRLVDQVSAEHDGRHDGLPPRPDRAPACRGRAVREPVAGSGPLSSAAWMIPDLGLRTA